MIRFLFVYGTLRKDIGHAMAEFLAERARFLGPARMAGRLYDLGPYPGMLEHASQNDWVHGDLFELEDAVATLAALDRYESLGSRPPLFERQTGEAILLSGDSVRAWVYLYRGPLEQARPIPSGDYREPTGAQTKKHAARRP